MPVERDHGTIEELSCIRKFASFGFEERELTVGGKIILDSVWYDDFWTAFSKHVNRDSVRSGLLYGVKLPQGFARRPRLGVVAHVPVDWFRRTPGRFPFRDARSPGD